MFFIRESDALLGELHPVFPSSQHPTDLSNAFEINTRVHGVKKKKCWLRSTWFNECYWLCSQRIYGTQVMTTDHICICLEAWLFLSQGGSEEVQRHSLGGGWGLSAFGQSGQVVTSSPYSQSWDRTNGHIHSLQTKLGEESSLRPLPYPRLHGVTLSPPVDHKVRT